MGVVYRARHTQTGAIHALKVVLPDYLGRDSERALARYRRESQVLARIDQHPGLVRIHAVGEDGDSPWCAMELVEGEPLSTVLARGNLSHSQSAELIAGVARAVDHAHRHGVIHRDLKPGNVIIDAQGLPRVVDFGLAFDARDERLTNTGELMGTPCFMAPEQVSRGSDDGSEPEIGPATDVYGIGALLYTCLIGSPPFSDRGGVSVLMAILRESPRPPRHQDASVPAALEAICLQALQRDPAKRQHSAMALAEELEEWLRGEKVPSSASARLRAQAAELLPEPSKRTLLVTGLALVLVGSLLAASVPPLIAHRPRAQDLSKLEATLATGRRLSASQIQTLQELEAAASPNHEDRVRALLLLTDLLALPPADVTNEPLTALAAHLRQNSRADQQRQAQRVLHAHNRMAQLHTLLHVAQPALTARKEVAANLARFLTSSDTAPWPPLDAAAFSRLLKAPGLKEEVRGQLLIQHARASLRSAAPNLKGVLEEVLQAQQHYGITLPAADCSAELLTLAGTEFLASISTENLDLARANNLDNLLARADGGDLDVSALEVSARQSTIITAIAMDRITPSTSGGPTPDAQRALLWLSFIERQGLSPLSRSQTETACNRVGVEQVIKVGNSEAKRPSTIRNPSLLITLTLLLCGRKNEDVDLVPPDHWEIANRWVDTARSAGVSAPWLHLSIARHLFNQGNRDEALEAMEQALRLDRQRPHERRITEIPQMMGTFLLGSDGRVASLEELRRAAVLAMEAASILEAHKPLISSFKKIGAITPRMLDRQREVRAILRTAADQLTKRGVQACCHGKPSVDELLQRGQKLFGGSGRGFATPEINMRHHRQHGRWPEALTSAREALTIARKALNRVYQDYTPERRAADDLRRTHILTLERSVKRLEAKIAKD